MRLQGVVLLLLSSVAASHATIIRAQSLAEVAQQEAERRKTVKSSGKVYTNKDLKDVPPRAPVAATPSQPAADTSKDQQQDGNKQPDRAKDAGTGQDKANSLPKDQAYWNGRIKALQTALDRDQTYVAALQSRINALTTDFVNRDDPVQRAAVGLERDKAAAELERLKKSTTEDKQAITDLEEEARRAGVPPGWLR